MSKQVRVYTLPEVARKLDVHRTTLKRMEDRGVIPPARWIEKPRRCRVYTEQEVEGIADAVAVYKAAAQGGVMVIDEASIQESGQ